jgi:D-amino-acid dehydrogenase
MHVCVIGAGVVGLTTAYFLHSEGHTVTVLDRTAATVPGTSGAGGAQLSYSICAVPGRDLLWPGFASFNFLRLLIQSQWSWGWAALRHANTRTAHETLAELLKLAQLSREFIEPLIDGEGIDCNLTRRGRLVIYDNAARLSEARAQMQYLIALGSKQKLLSRDECITREPTLKGQEQRIAGGIWIPGDATADSGAFCAQLAALLERRGVTFLHGRTATQFDLDQGRVRAVLTDGTAGETPLRADAFVLAAGGGARSLAATAGLRLPIIALRAYSITIKPDGVPIPEVSINDARRRLVFAPLGERLRVSGFAEIVNPGIDVGESVAPRRTAALLDAARETLGYRVVDGDVRPWSGLRPMTPNSRPLLGRTSVRGLYLNVGHGALGWTLAAGCARLLCDAIADRTPTIDLAPSAILPRP